MTGEGWWIGRPVGMPVRIR
ncbi:hypothetical protein KCP71_03265 [Salmonella enterica subsp. enterica]|nr:hypothetical protein KCP71_03265 [Salmonella enterica subsp. enterica]